MYSVRGNHHRRLLKLLERESLVERRRCMVGRGRRVRENGVSNFEIKIREKEEEDVCERKRKTFFSVGTKVKFGPFIKLNKIDPNRTNESRIFSTLRLNQFDGLYFDTHTNVPSPIQKHPSLVI
ncbi:hypothetical protein HYC85_004861 [Camellia sinensis]|uniref:Uncharacterized protein n=1 Tax=Camellia sinensis TaxID=4442 RepID=A0A7J7HZN1_CAMSI|nr:hypothetical protein HYC85_004861 [Camellia sinensis]